MKVRWKGEKNSPSGIPLLAQIPVFSCLFPPCGIIIAPSLCRHRSPGPGQENQLLNPFGDKFCSSSDPITQLHQFQCGVLVRGLFGCLVSLLSFSTFRPPFSNQGPNFGPKFIPAIRGFKISVIFNNLVPNLSTFPLFEGTWTLNL